MLWAMTRDPLKLGTLPIEHHEWKHYGASFEHRTEPIQPVRPRAIGVIDVENDHGLRVRHTQPPGRRNGQKGMDGVQRDFYVRQLWDMKGSVKVERMDARALTAYAQLCGMTLAHAHARSGDRIAIAAYLGKGAKFDEAMATFAESYADQNQRDYEALKAAVDEGRIEATATA